MALPLVVGVDGSESSLRATDWAADEAVRHGSALRLVYASVWQFYEGVGMAAGKQRPAGRVAAENIVGAAAERARSRAPDLKVTTEVMAKDTVAALLDESRTAAAVVTGARGRGEIAGLLLGSVSLAVAARAYSPVIVVRGDEAGISGRHGRVLLGVGDADTDSPAVRFAFEEAAAYDRMLDVVRAWRTPAFQGRAAPDQPEGRLDEQASAVLARSIAGAQRDHPDVRTRQSVIEGPASRVLLDRTAAADLLVVGARRQHTPFGLEIGRVAHRVLHYSLCPVAVVPQRM